MAALGDVVGASGRSYRYSARVVDKLLSDFKELPGMICSDNVLRDTAHKAPYSPQELGTRFQLEECEINNCFVRGGGNNDPVEVRFQILHTWKQKLGKDATNKSFLLSLSRCLPEKGHFLDDVCHCIANEHHFSFKSPVTLSVQSDSSQKLTEEPINQIINTVSNPPKAPLVDAKIANVLLDSQRNILKETFRVKRKLKETKLDLEVENKRLKLTEEELAICKEELATCKEENEQLRNKLDRYEPRSHGDSLPTTSHVPRSVSSFSNAGSLSASSFSFSSSFESAAELNLACQVKSTVELTATVQPTDKHYTDENEESSNDDSLLSKILTSSNITVTISEVPTFLMDENARSEWVNHANSIETDSQNN